MEITKCTLLRPIYQIIYTARMVKDKLVKPYLKWAGGKRQLADTIRSFCPDRFSKYYEPFVGAGAILFDLQPKHAVINDLNEQLYYTYLAVRDNVEELITLLEQHQKKNTKDYYYEIRALDRTEEFNSLSIVEKAARLIYLNKTCYNGLYRVNSQGLFNTPYGRYVNPAICEREVLRHINRYFKNNDLTILNGDFEIAVSTAKKGDFVYFDPPYDSPNCTNFTGYQAGGFDHDEQTRLRDCMVDLTKKGVRCLLSNASTDFINRIYREIPEFTIEYVEAKRPINSDSNGRGNVTEVLVRNW